METSGPTNVLPLESHSLPCEISAMLNSVQKDISKFLELGAHAEVLGLAERAFFPSGKLMRPRVILLMAALCNKMREETTPNVVSKKQYKIAMVSEMIHVASLIHDDIIDEATTRRGAATFNESDGCSTAVFLGDFILAQATLLLTSIGSADVIRILAQVIEDLVRGELMQADQVASEENSFADYVLKSYKKTGSLFSHSLKAVMLTVAVLGCCSNYVVDMAFNFGRNFGIMFQLVDDLLDFTSTDGELGKPTGADLRAGVITGPVLFACRQYPEVADIIRRQFAEPGDFDRCMSLVGRSDGILRTKQLAEQFRIEASRCLHGFPDCEYRRCLDSICKQRISQIN
ncbi:decaprenyl diphosphate synthase subunit 1 [Trichuris trichiura]|uniref:Decaprenyl diphosphate synthase subunit 1 n=1 Tax=Trichuris trichiura TaxID=36087 RepID=A0A077ZCH7_TRITR|nr:decaprenyl diphosphate synthase subunit 1 [Trichuris trichiura]